MGRIFKILFNTLLIIVIILLSGYCILRFTDKVRIYNVETGSMEDKIHTGDYIILVKKNDYFVGDVVTYNVNGYFITHRIIKIENGVITTKGDANNTEDEGITKDQIEGKVIYCGGILNFVINFKYAIAAFLIGLYLLSCYFGDGSEEIKEEDKLSLDDVNEEVIEDQTFEVKEESEIINDAVEKNIISDENKIIIEETKDIKEADIEKTKKKRKKKTEEVKESTIIEENQNEEKEEIKEKVEKPKKTRKSKKEKVVNETTNEEIKKTKKSTKSKKINE